MFLVLFIVILCGIIGLVLFQYMEQKRKNRIIEKHERRREQFEELLKLISDKKPEVSDTRDDEHRTES